MADNQKLNIPVDFQYELALLWRTLNIIKSISIDIKENVSALTSFYSQLLVIVTNLPPLSLSAYWDNRNLKLYSKNESDTFEFNNSKKPNKIATNFVSIPSNALDEIHVTTGIEDSIYDANLPELDYLKERSFDHDHDPVKIIQNLYDLACSLIPVASTEEREVLVSFTLMVGIKSGRVSYLLHVIWMLKSIQCKDINFNLRKLLKDIWNYVKPSVAEEKLHLATKEIEYRFLNFYQIDAEFFHLSTNFHQLNSMSPLNFVPRLDINIDDVHEQSKNIILSFGKADHGKLGHGDVHLNRLFPTIIEGLVGFDIVRVASMSTYAVALDSAGAVYVWGTGGSASVSNAAVKSDIVPQILEALPLKSKVVDVSCGLGHALFLVDEGKVYSWGNGGNGRLGLGDLHDRTEAAAVSELANETVSMIQCGASHSMALTKTGRVYSWGKNTQGQCGQGTNEDILRPTVVSKIEGKNIVQLAAGWEHSLALTAEGRLFSWGCGYKDSRRGIIPPVLGLGNNDCRLNPELITSIESIRIVKVTCGWDHCIALDSKGKTLSWGSGQNGKLGHGTEENISVPCYIPSLENLCVVSIAAGCEHSAAITDDGSIMSWGHGDGGRLGHGDNNQCFTPTKIDAMKLMNLR